MRILFFTQYFVPEVTAPRVRAQAFAEGLAARGHEVEVICEVPNHPTGIVYPGYGEEARSTGAGSTATTRPTCGCDERREDDHATGCCSTAPTPRPRPRSGRSPGGPTSILASSPPLPVGAAAAIVPRLATGCRG